jgi:predicted dehydrogenase
MSTAQIGVGLISVGWMGKLHSRAYQALGLRPRLVHAADTTADRAQYAWDVLGYEQAGGDYRDVLADPEVDGDGELGEVQNDDYVATLVRFAPGAVGTLEASRIIVGPQCGLGFEVYGTSGGWRTVPKVLGATYGGCHV